MAVYEIPLTPEPQRFTIRLAGADYVMTLRYIVMPDTIAAASGWFLDLADMGARPILAGVPLVTGADILEQYAYLGIGGSLLVVTDGDATAVPTAENLGAEAHLYFLTGDEA